MGQFHETSFPTDIGKGSAGGPGYKNNVIEQANAVDERVARQSTPRWRFNVAYGIRSMEDLALVQRFYVARRGVLIAFRFKDFLDFHSHPSNPSYTGAQGTKDQLLGTGDTATTQFQLVKRYTDGVGSAIVRTIRKPVNNGSMQVWLDNTLKTEGVDYTVNYTTGVITFASPPGNGVQVSASFQFDVPVRFGREVDEELQAAINDFDSGNIPDIPLVEDLNPEVGYVSDMFYGGSKQNAIYAVDFTITPGEGRVWPVKMTASGKFVNLPATTSLPTGRAILTIINDGSIAFGIKDPGGSTLVASLTTGQGIDCHVILDGSGNKIWLLA